jgi:CheY-like chemotaxis protein
VFTSRAYFRDLPEIHVARPEIVCQSDSKVVDCMRSDGQPFVLIAEDGEADVELLRRSFNQAGLHVPMHIVGDGEECIAYLSGVGRYMHREEYPLPDLLLLDLKMPRKNGFEVLKWLRSQPGFSALRVVVLTTSERIRDINEAYALGANSFLTKPLNFVDFTNTIQAMYNFWMEHSKKPQIERPPLKNPMAKEIHGREE